METRTVLFVVYEGKKTELNYMENLETSGLIRSHMIPIKIEKCGLDENTTERRELVKIAFDEMMFQNHGINTIRRFISHSLSNLTDDDKEILLDNEHIIGRDKRKRENMRGYPSIRKKISEKIEELKCLDDSKQYVIYNNKGALNAIKDVLAEYGVRNYVFENIDTIYSKNKKINDLSEKKIQYNSEVWIVFDRDERDITKDDFLSAINSCKAFGYSPVISSPKFELWLSMHHRNFDYNDPKASYRSDYGDHLDDVLDELEDGIDTKIRDGKRTRKEISSKRFKRYYLNNIYSAIMTSKKDIFRINPTELEDRPGSNFGSYLLKIMDN